MVADRRSQAEKLAARLQKQGHQLAPVRIEGRLIASTFWGKAWCENLEAYRDFENRLPRGRSYVRNGAVIDLQIAPAEVRALVNGSALYETSVTIRPMAAPAWRRLCADCAGRIDSLVELLQGRFSKTVMQRLCRQETGLFPRPAEIRFTCSCPDHAAMCKHVAAMLYGVGARLDAQPELLFRLRGVEGADLLAGAAEDMPFASGPPAAGRVLGHDDVAALFGIDVAMSAESAPDSAPSVHKQAPRRSSARPPAGGAESEPATTAVAGTKKVSEAGRRVPRHLVSKAASASPAPSREAPARSRPVVPTTRPTRGAKTAATPDSRQAAPVLKLAKARQRSQGGSTVSRAGPDDPDTAAPSGASKEKRERGDWSWKALAAARKAKRR